jgi:hypothetical protein
MFLNNCGVKNSEKSTEIIGTEYFNGKNNSTDIVQNNNQDEMRNDFKELIKNGKLIQLNSLKKIDKEIYNIIKVYISENEMENYFLSISIDIYGTVESVLTIKEYKKIKKSPEYIASGINHIDYNFWYYEILKNKYDGWRGDPTQKCFTVRFNKNNEFLKIIRWR